MDGEEHYCWELAAVAMMYTARVTNLRGDGFHITNIPGKKRGWSKYKLLTPHKDIDFDKCQLRTAQTTLL